MHSMDSNTSPYAPSIRPEIHDMLPDKAVRFLDVGCNDGRFGEWIKATRPGASVTGIESNVGQAALARERLDHVVVGTYPGALVDVDGEFDCITFNHVLEHIVDPWEALQATLPMLSPDGRVVALIPNVRYITLIYDLLVRGKWTYTDTGLLDRTHVRFFTRRSALDMFRLAGYEVARVKPVNAFGNVRAPRLSGLLTKLLGELTCGGFVFLAVPGSQP